MTQPTYQLDEFRFQNDAGSDASPSWKENSNTDTSLTIGGATILLRFQMHNTNSKSGVETWNWEYSLNGGGWTAISTSSVVARAVTPGTYTAADTDNCSNQLTSRAGSYVTANSGHCYDGVGTSYTHDADFYAETALAFFIPDTVDVSASDDIEIRIVESSGDTVDYNSLTANITATAAATPDPFTPLIPTIRRIQYGGILNR